MDKKYVLMLSEREFCDLKAILVMAATKLPAQLTSEQEKILESVKGIAKQIDDIDQETKG